MVAQQPEWARQPLALVKEQRPTALLLEVNTLAAAQGLRPGMRYGEALAQVPALRARCLTAQQRQQIKDEMVEKLRAFSPEIEACGQNTGVFYAGLTGLLGLYASWDDWVKAVHQGLGYQARVVVGFSRFGALAVSRRAQAPPRQILDSVAEEDRLSREAPLWRLGVPAKLVLSLEQLGVVNLGQFLKLSSESLLERYGREAYELHRRAKKTRWDPLRPQAEPIPWVARMSLDYAEPDRQRLLLLCKRLLQPLLLGLFRKGRAVNRMEWVFQLQSGQKLSHPLGLSEPSLEANRLLDLLRLRLETLQLEAGVTDLELILHDSEGPPQQLELFAESSRREVQAANRALDRVRAELGAESVVQARLCDGHLPAAGFRWEALTKLSGRPLPREGQLRLLRRFFATPPKRLRPDVQSQLAGPFRLSGGWWNREIERDYYYLVDARGQLDWGYFDQRRGEWFLQGRLE